MDYTNAWVAYSIWQYIKIMKESKKKKPSDLNISWTLKGLWGEGKWDIGVNQIIILVFAAILFTEWHTQYTIRDFKGW